MDNVISQIKKIIITTVQNTSQNIFNLSQQNVPQRSGKLKNSGSYVLIKNGAVINYNSEYAATQEFGRPERPIKGNQIVNVKEYKRKSYLKKDGIRIAEAIVPGHVVMYKGKRLIPIHVGGKTLFRVIKKWPKIEGKFFLTRAIQEGFQDFVKDLRRNLKAGLKIKGE